MTFARFAAWLIGITVGLAVAVSSPTSVFAQEYDETTIEEVNAHFSKGAQLYYDGQYDAAIAEFEAAHAKIPNGVFLYNISLAYARKGDTARALETAREAQEFGGLGEEELKQNEARIVALQRVQQANEASSEIAANLPPPVEPLFDFGPTAWVGSALVVGGLLGYGGVLIIDRNLSADVEAYREAARNNDNVAFEDLKDEIRPRQRAGRIIFTLSTLAVASGATLLVYDLLLRKSNDDTIVTFAPTHDGAAISLTRRF